jgi:tRNA G18 (ribose-2'-O)-methylase SpoU
MKKLTHDEISRNRSTLDNLHKVKRLPVYVVLNSIRSSYNVGSIFRSSDGAMIEKLYLCGYTPKPEKVAASARYHENISAKEILKTALGSTRSVNWEYVKNPKEIIMKLKEERIKICSLEMTDKSIPYYNLTVKDFPICLLVGNEITGVAQELVDLSEISIEIPQYGIKQSLNVAVAYGIAVFELRKIFDLNKTIL